MTDSKLTLVVAAKNLAAGELGTLKRGLVGVKDAAGSLASGIGLSPTMGVAGAATLLVGVLGSSIQAALEEEKSIAKLDSALKANVAGWDGNRGAIEKVLKARMDLGFADDEQRDSLALLVAATHDQTKALDIQRTAMDLARFKGIDLKTASEALIKVEGGQFRALKALGIQLKDGATATDALAAVQKAAAGQAEAYANTNSGKLEVATIKVGEAMEQLGGVALPLVATAATELTGAIGGLSSVLDLLNLKLPDSKEGFDGLIRTFNSLNPSTWSFGRTLDGIEGKLDAAAAAASEAWRKIAATKDADSSVAALSDTFETARLHSVAIAARTPGDIATALRTGRTSWQDAVKLLGEDLEHAMGKAAEMAAIEAALAGKELARGLKSTDPIVRAQAQETKRILTEQLEAVATGGKGYGKGIGAGVADGLNSQVKNVEKAAKNIAHAVTKYIRTDSPAEAGPLSEMGGPEGMGKKVAKLFGDGLGAFAPNVAFAMDAGLRGGSGSARPSIGGGRRVIQLVVSGKVLAEVLDEENYWRDAGAGVSSLRG